MFLDLYKLHFNIVLIKLLNSNISYSLFTILFL